MALGENKIKYRASFSAIETDMLDYQGATVR